MENDLDIVLPPDRGDNANDRGIVHEKETAHYPKKEVLTLSPLANVRKSVPIGKIPVAVVDAVEPFAPDLQLKFVLSEKPELNSPLSVYVANEPEKRSPWKGWRLYEYVEKLAELRPNEAYIKIHELDIKNITKAGISFAWSLVESTLYFHLLLKPELIFDHLFEGNVFEASKLYSHDGFVHYSKVYVLNQLLLLAYPQHKETIRVCSPFDEPPTSFEVNKREDFQFFFEQVKIFREQHLDPPPNYQLSLDGLTSVLRPYQKEAVRFMMHRELCPQIKKMDHLLRYIRLSGGLHYIPALGVFCRMVDDLELYHTGAKGGILAEEMGLGKTVELLALILSLSKENIDKVVKTNPMLERERSDVEETVDFLVSNVVASIEGEAGLNKLKIASSLTANARVHNAIFNLNTYGQTRSGRCNESVIKCAECGTNCLKKNMHWKDEYSQEGYTFKCPDCMSMGDRMDVSCTLVIVPQAILHQWYEEIRRHVREDVIIDVYLGVVNECYKHPVYLNKCHIVLCAYETLTKEIEFIEPVQERRTLRKRSYELCKRVSSPLVAVNWWRVCLDEAQLVESASRRSAELCRHLTARARWCVTGTPLVDSVNDLYGLVSFIGCYPLNQKTVWTAHIWRSWISEKHPERLLTLMSQLFWRRSKKDVQEQLWLPPVTHEVVPVAFSPLEERLYTEKIKELREKIVARLSQLAYPETTPLSHLPQKVVREIMDSLHEVRLSIVTGDSHVRVRCRVRVHRRDDDEKKEKMVTKMMIKFTPDALFRRLFLNNKTELEEETRGMVANINGLAGLYAIYRPAECLSKYKEVFEVEKETLELNKSLGLTGWQNKHGDSRDDATSYRREMMIDRTQIVHVCRNMQSIIESSLHNENRKSPEETKKGFEAFLNGEKEEYSRMQIELAAKERENVLMYSRRERANLGKLQRDWRRLAEHWALYDKAFDSSLSWVLVLLDASPSSHNSAFVDILRQIRGLGIGSLFSRVRSPFQLWPILLDEMGEKQGEMGELRRAVQEWATLPFEIKQEDGSVAFGSSSPVFQAMMRCEHNAIWQTIRPDQETEPERNGHSAVDIRNVAKNRLYFLKYDCPSCNLRTVIHNLQKKEEIVDQMRDTIPLENGQWYQLFSLLHRLSYQPKLDGSLFKQGRQRQLQWFELFRRTTFLAHQLLDACQELVSRHLELEEASSRFHVGMRIGLPDRTGRAAFYFQREIQLEKELNPNIEMLMDRFQSAVVENRKSRDECATRLKYLDSLHTANVAGAARECPVCYQLVEDMWNVFPCAHLLCVECYQNFLRTSEDNGYLRCVSCRHRFPVDSVSLVVKKETEESKKKNEIVPEARFTVKFNALVDRIRMILDADFSNKVLVFTSMTQALDPLFEVFRLAEIPFRKITGKVGAVEQLAAFRNDAEIRVLVLPLSQGANGLNLTQANHVIFLEPITDTSAMSQAIGRMSRFGQHRSMEVHHLIMTGSIEEQIYNIVQKEGENEEGWTIDTLTAVLAI